MTRMDDLGEEFTIKFVDFHATPIRLHAVMLCDGYD